MLKNKKEETIFMKRKLIIYFCIFILLILGLVFASSHVQALSKQEWLGRKQEFREELRNNRSENNQICRNVQERIAECDFCEQNEYCQVHQNINCINRQNQCLTSTHKCRRNCVK